MDPRITAPHSLSSVAPSTVLLLLTPTTPSIVMSTASSVRYILLHSRRVLILYKSPAPSSRPSVLIGALVSVGVVITSIAIIFFVCLLGARKRTFKNQSLEERSDMVGIDPSPLLQTEKLHENAGKRISCEVTAEDGFPPDNSSYHSRISEPTEMTSTYVTAGHCSEGRPTSSSKYPTASVSQVQSPEPQIRPGPGRVKILDPNVEPSKSSTSRVNFMLYPVPSTAGSSPQSTNTPDDLANGSIQMPPTPSGPGAFSPAARSPLTTAFTYSYRMSPSPKTTPNTSPISVRGVMTFVARVFASPGDTTPHDLKTLNASHIPMRQESEVDDSTARYAYINARSQQATESPTSLKDTSDWVTASERSTSKVRLYMSSCQIPCMDPH
jgi:hypothetical protein